MADSLSRAPLPGDAKEMIVLHVTADPEGESLFKSVREQQRQDKELDKLVRYLQNKELPIYEQAVRQVLKMDKKGFVIVEGILYYEGDGADGCCLVVPSHLQQNYLTNSMMEYLLVTLPIRRCIRG